MTINFDKLSKSLGYKSYFRISKKGELKSVLKKFLNNKNSALLEVLVKTHISKDLPRPGNLIKIKENFIR